MNFNIIVTSKCNLKCKYCYEGNEKSQKSMSIDIAKKTIDFIINTLVERDESNRRHKVIFHGGEPMLNFKVIEFIKSELDKKLDKKFIINYMTTINGTVINDEMIDFIKENDIYLSLSIDGTQKIHDQNRIFHDGTGSYLTMEKNLNRLKQHGIIPRARMTYKSSNVSNLYESIVNIANLGFEVCVPVADFYDKDWSDKKVEILENQIDKIINDENLKKMRISIVNKETLCRKTNDCFAGVATVTISENGDLYPCAFTLGEPKFIIGNLQDDKFLNSNKVNKIFEEIVNETNNCDGCQAQDRCSGHHCKLLNYMVTGKYNVVPSINCRLMGVELNTYKKLHKRGVTNELSR